MNRIHLASIACAFTAALALTACNKPADNTAPGSTGSSTTSASPGTTGGGMGAGAARAPASAASR
jgi:hypothetical protein